MCKAANFLDSHWDVDSTVWCAFLFSRDVDIWMPEMEQQEVPAGWWDAESDRSLLAGVYKHGGFSLEQCCMQRKKTDQL